MSAATQAIDTPERSGQVRNLPVAAAVALWAGALACTDSAGRLVPAANTAGLRLAGRVEEDADNSAGLADAINANVKHGVFRYANSATAAVDADDIGKDCFVEDDTTVAETTTNKVKAGRVVAVDSEGVWVDTRAGAVVPSADTLTALTFTGGGATGPEVEALRDAVLAILQAQGLSL